MGMCGDKPFRWKDENRKRRPTKKEAEAKRVEKEAVMTACLLKEEKLDPTAFTAFMLDVEAEVDGLLKKQEFVNMRTRSVVDSRCPHCGSLVTGIDRDARATAWKKAGAPTTAGYFVCLA